MLYYNVVYSGSSKSAVGGKFRRWKSGLGRFKLDGLIQTSQHGLACRHHPVVSGGGDNFLNNHSESASVLYSGCEPVCCWPADPAMEERTRAIQVGWPYSSRAGTAQHGTDRRHPAVPEKGLIC